MFDLRKIKASDMRDCPRLQLPSVRPQEKELMMSTKEQLWSQIYAIYAHKHCNDKGYHTVDNMTKSERTGFRKLIKRKKDLKIIIGKTEKSAKNTVSTRESYLAQGEPHVTKAKVVKWQDFDKGRREALAHTKVMSNIFCIGEAYGEKNQLRVRKALHEDSSVIPSLVMN